MRFDPAPGHLHLTARTGRIELIEPAGRIVGGERCRRQAFFSSSQSPGVLKIPVHHWRRQSSRASRRQDARQGNRGVVNIQPIEDVSLQRESLTDQRPRAVQFALPIRPVMRTWPVQVNLCIQSELLYAAGECLVLRSD